MGYTVPVFEIVESATFKRWRQGLKDRVALARVQARVAKLALGHFGDAKSLGPGLHEMRIDHGPGYRLYFSQQGSVLIVMLVGG